MCVVNIVDDIKINKQLILDDNKALRGNINTIKESI